MWPRRCSITAARSLMCANPSVASSAISMLLGFSRVVPQPIPCLHSYVAQPPFRPQVTDTSIRPLQRRFSRAFLPCSYPLPPATSQGSNRPLPQRPLLQAGFLLLCDLTFAATATSSPAPAPCSCSPASAVLPHAVEALSGSPCYGRLILCFLDLMALAPLFRDMRSKCF